MKIENAQSGTVYFARKKAGTLRKTATGYEFSYGLDYLDDPAALPISLGIPLRKEPYFSERLFPFFEGLLTEGWLLDLVSRTLKIDPDDKFNLLLRSGDDTIGAVTVKPEKTR